MKCKSLNINQTYLQEFFDSSDTVLCCIQTPKTKVIHRSLLFEAIKERKEPPLAEKRGKEPLLTQILTALEATQESTHIQDSSKDLVEESDEGKNNEESSEKLGDKNKEEANDETEERSEKQEQDLKSENISKIAAALEKLDQAHREANKILDEANQHINNPGVTKVGKMQKKIQSVKDNLGEKEKKEVHLLDQPNSRGITVMHITTREDDDEATQLLLNHGANPNVQDPDGNSPLHTICNQRDIQTATWLVKNNGRVLENVQKETPALHELFFDQDEDEVKKLMEAICLSNHRREILEDTLRKNNLLFRLVKRTSRSSCPSS